MNPIKTGSVFRFYGRVSTSFPASGSRITREINRVINHTRLLVMNDEKGT